MKRALALALFAALVVPQAVSADIHPGPWPQSREVQDVHPGPWPQAGEPDTEVTFTYGFRGLMIDERCGTDREIMRVVLFEDIDRGGWRVRICGVHDAFTQIPLNPVGLASWNDRASGARLKRTTPGWCPALFEHTGYGGRIFPLLTDLTPDFTVYDFNDQASSIGMTRDCP